MMAKIGLLTKCFLACAAGTVVVLVVVHLYFDHKALHEMATYINQAAPKIQKLP